MRYRLRYTPERLEYNSADMEGQAEEPSRAQETPSKPWGADFPRLLQAQYASFQEDLPFWLTLAASGPGPILELGCGPGRVLSVLAQAGFEVDGLDYDPEMLRRAASRLPTSQRGPVSLIQGDLGRFSLGRKYGLILLPCNTFAILDESAAEESLACIRRHLLPGGVFAAELPSPHEALEFHVDPAEPIDAFVEPETGNPIQVYADQRAEAGQNLVQVAWRYDELRPDGTVIRTQVPMLYYLWSPEGLGEAARRSGFSSHEAFGDYDRRPFSPDSRRLLFTACA